MEGSRMEEREGGGEGEGPARKEGREISERRRGRFTTAGRSPPARSVGNEREGGARSPSRITDRRERRKAKSCGIYVAVAPLPNYYLVIFLSECSVNALHRNTANRSGWIDRLSVASKVSVM